MLGRVIDILAIEYDYKKDHKNIKGRGNRVVGMARGDEGPEGCKITVLQSDFEAMQASLPKGKTLVHLAPFDITCSYAPEGGEIKTDILKYCRVKSQKKGMKQGDGNMTVDLDLEVAEIEYNA